MADDSFETIQSLVDDAGDGDSIYLESKNYVGNGSSIYIRKNIEIYGSDDSDTVLDAGGKSNIFVISNNVNVILNGLTFINGKTTGNGGAINNDGNLIVSNSSFINNTAYGGGGAIYMHVQNYARVQNSYFEGNTATNSGTGNQHGAAISSASNAYIYNCTF